MDKNYLLIMFWKDWVFCWKSFVSIGFVKIKSKYNCDMNFMFVECCWFLYS